MVSRPASGYHASVRVSRQRQGIMPASGYHASIRVSCQHQGINQWYGIMSESVYCVSVSFGLTGSLVVRALVQ
jgi:hypothetical protein